MSLTRAEAFKGQNLSPRDDNARAALPLNDTGPVGWSVGESTSGSRVISNSWSATISGDSRDLDEATAAAVLRQLREWTLNPKAIDVDKSIKRNALININYGMCRESGELHLITNQRFAWGRSCFQDSRRALLRE
ncbi:hypothetical protein [Tardiphaga sp. OK245]|uniref:hypothetical protein n=1 Tax=Tardiphaga sp. OK245 TaxID=1855306 RepID=UPI00147BBCA4|nr:hypothetical protein [Tardiphaga sp. OK245]